MLFPFRKQRFRKKEGFCAHQIPENKKPRLHGVFSKINTNGKSGLADFAFQFVIVFLGDKLRQVRAVIIFGSDRIALLNALAGLSLVDNLGALGFRDFDFASLLDVVELHVAAPFCVGFQIRSVSCATKKLSCKKTNANQILKNP